MSDLVDSDLIESIVGAARHEELHLGRWVSSTNIVYILHPHQCAARVTLRPLTECAYSRELDYGLSEDMWDGWQDQTAVLRLSVSGMIPTSKYPLDTP